MNCRFIKQIVNRLFDRIDSVLSALLDQSSGNRRFVIFTSGRSGSSLLRSLLNQHPGVRCFGEIFNRDKILLGPECKGTFVSSRFAYRIRRIFPRLFLIALWSSQRKFGTIGFKYIWFHSSIERESILYNPNIKKIMLTRRNVLRAEVSRQIVDVTQEWSSSSGPAKRFSIKFDIEKFWRHYNLTNYEVDGLKLSLTERDQKYHEVFFEEITSGGRGDALARLCSFLDIDNFEFKYSEIKLKRQNPFPLRELLTNYQSVVESLSGTKAEWMLNDDLCN